MRSLATLVLSLSFVLACAACKKEEASGKPAADTPKPAPGATAPAAEPGKPAAAPAQPGAPAEPAAAPAAPAAPAAGWTTKTFDDLKQVSFDVPADAEMLTAVTNEFVQASAGDFYVSVGVDKFKQSYADQVSDSEKDEDCTFASWVKKEEIADGWVIHYVCKVEDKTYHKVNVRRTIAGTVYECSWDRLKTDADAEATIRSCLSLKASGK